MAKGTLVVSLRSKGLASFNRQSFDFRHQAISFGIEAFDVVISYVLTLFQLSWTSWMSLIVTILCLSISMSGNAWLTHRQEEHNADVAARVDAGSASSVTSITDGVMTGSTALAFFLPFLGVLFLPLGLLTVMVFWRREHALSQVGGFKAHAVSLCLAACGDNATPAMGEASSLIRKQVFMLLDNLHRYLHHKRPYARHFYLPYSASNDSSAPGNEMLFHVSREMGILLRKLHLSVRDVHGSVQLLRNAGAGEAHVDMLMQQVTSMHKCVEQLCNIKEQRTPVMLRAAVRWTSVVVFPVFLGFFCFCLKNVIPYLSDSIGLLVIHVQLALVVMTDVVVSMEDPFDDTALDTLSLFEVLDHVAAMTTPEDADALGVSHDTAVYVARESSQGGAPYVVDPLAPPRPSGSHDPAAQGTSLGDQHALGAEPSAGSSAAVQSATAAGASTISPSQVVYTVSLPAGATTATGRRQNPSLPMPPMPSNLT